MSVQILQTASHVIKIIISVMGHAFLTAPSPNMLSKTLIHNNNHVKIVPQAVQIVQIVTHVQPA